MNETTTYLIHGKAIPGAFRGTVSGAAICGVSLSGPIDGDTLSVNVWFMFYTIKPHRNDIQEEVAPVVIPKSSPAYKLSSERCLELGTEGGSLTMP